MSSDFVISAEVYSDSSEVEIQFDALSWFQQADDEDIIDLADCGWGGDYPADEVAEFFSTDGGPCDKCGQSKSGPTADLFAFLEVANRYSRESLGYECHVDENMARAWLKVNRPGVFKKLEIPEEASSGEV